MRSFSSGGWRFFVRTGDYWLATFLTIGSVYFFSGRFTPVQFDRERIEVELSKARIRVHALYHYGNPSVLPAVLTLRVPFPVDSNHPEPDWYYLNESTVEGQALSSLTPILRGGQVYFRLVFRPLESKWIQLDYGQRAETPEGRYMLTTTQAWRRPIQHADYVLRLAPDLELVSSNYVVQPSPWAGPGRVYSFSRTDFYPDQDWVFSWTDVSMQTMSARGVQR